MECQAGEYRIEKDNPSRDGVTSEFQSLVQEYVIDIDDVGIGNVARKGSIGTLYGTKDISRLYRLMH